MAMTWVRASISNSRPRVHGSVQQQITMSAPRTPSRPCRATASCSTANLSGLGLRLQTVTDSMPRPRSAATWNAA